MQKSTYFVVKGLIYIYVSDTQFISQEPSHDNPEWSLYLGLHKDGYRFSAYRFLPARR